MQNLLEISSRYNFGTRNVRNWSKSLTESLRKDDGKFTESPRPVQEDPYGPTWAHIGPYGPIWTHIWAHKGAYGPIYGPQPGLGPNPARASMEVHAC